MKILVLGAGATGGYFGGRLHQAGADVTFLVRTKRAQQLATQGLVIESTKDKVALPVKTVLAEAVKPDYDIVILACKAFDLGSSIAAITPAMGSATCVLPLLNGISHLDVLDAAPLVFEFGGAFARVGLHGFAQVVAHEHGGVPGGDVVQAVGHRCTRIRPVAVLDMLSRQRSQT